jgi:hypothetical protein
MDLVNSRYEIIADNDLLIGREEGERVKEAVCQRLKQLSALSILTLSFNRVKFMDISGADEVVAKVLARLAAGEFPDRFVTLASLKVQHRENIEMALEVAGRAVVVDLGQRRWTILGHLNAALRRVLAYIADKGAATARELVDRLDIEPVNTASTRLVQLYSEGLVAREPWREPVRGGGRQFRYRPLVRGKYIEQVTWANASGAASG